MIRLAILDSHGKVVLPNDVATAAELIAVVEQAKGLIRECERLAQNKQPQRSAAASGQIPYLT
jgi:hypothetical protein